MSELICPTYCSAFIHLFVRLNIIHLKYLYHVVNYFTVKSTLHTLNTITESEYRCLYYNATSQVCLLGHHNVIKCTYQSYICGSIILIIVQCI